MSHIATILIRYIKEVIAMSDFEIAYTQHRGKRNLHQQDALWNGKQAIQHIDIPCRAYTLSTESLLLAVADGVAVSPNPYIASLFVIKTLGMVGGAEVSLTSRRVRDIHGLLCDRYAKGRTRGSSTTLVAVRCTSDACEVTNVGDSRAYQISADGHWQQLSHDHTILNDMIASGEAEAGREYACMYQGLAHCLVADSEEEDFRVHFCRSPFSPGDSILLCSDGLHDTLGDDRLRNLYNASASPLEQVKIWRKAVMAAGAPDNFSIIFSRRFTG
jgi:serine/threonine protein phosphatase PrpC